MALKEVRIPALRAKLGKHDAFLFFAKGRDIWAVTKINQRVEDKEVGYQRALSRVRVRKVANFLDENRSIPGNIVISFEDAKFDTETNELIIPNRVDAGWIVDGQHRLAGSFEAKGDHILAFIAFNKLAFNEQVELFVTINKEQKGVSSSLYFDLLKYLPDIDEKDRYKLRAEDLSSILKQDELSPFYKKIVATGAPKKGQISLTQFVRKVEPLLKEGTGSLSMYTDEDKATAMSNLYFGLKLAFPTEYNSATSVFFQTIGFGGIFGAFPSILTSILSNGSKFTATNIASLLKEAEIDPAQWKNLGTGTKAEKAISDEITLALSNVTRSPF